MFLIQCSWDNIVKRTEGSDQHWEVLAPSCSAAITADNLGDARVDSSAGVYCAAVLPDPGMGYTVLL